MERAVRKKLSSTLSLSSFTRPVKAVPPDVVFYSIGLRSLLLIEDLKTTQVFFYSTNEGENKWHFCLKSRAEQKKQRHAARLTPERALLSISLCEIIIQNCNRFN